jgi:hypothetical protein
MPGPERPAARVVVRMVAIGAALWALIVWATGGPHLQLLGIRFSSTNPIRPLLVSCLAYALFFRWWPAAFRAHIRFVTSLPTRRPHVTASVIAAAVLYFAFAWAANVASGADSYGYVSQAGLWRSGDLAVQQEIVRHVPWPNAQWTFAPLGYRPAAQDDRIVPTYSPGLPLLMALFQAVLGYCGAYLIVPLCGGALVWLTYELGRRLFDSTRVPLWGALLVATSPAFLFQVVWPMTDIPVATTWTAALLLIAVGRPLLAGLAMSATLAIRPNLVPLPAAVFLWSVLRDYRFRKSEGWFRCTVPLGLGLVPAVVGVAVLNARLYGSPLSSGYGNSADLYSWENFWPNAVNYGSWTVETQTAAVTVGLLFFLAPRLFARASVPFPRVLLGGAIVGNLVSYLFYFTFSDWWYLRFLLPIWPVMMLLTVASVDAAAGRWLPRVRVPVLAVIATFLAWHGARLALDRGVSALGRGERRYVDVARYVATHTDRRAVVIAEQHSGSIRHYAGRLTMRYDFLDENWLDGAAAYLQSIGRHPYILLESWEVAPFKQRFAGKNRLGALNWAPVAVLDVPAPVALYDAVDVSPEGLTAPIPPTSMNRTNPWPCEQPVEPVDAGP